SLVLCAPLIVPLRAQQPPQQPAAPQPGAPPRQGQQPAPAQQGQQPPRPPSPFENVPEAAPQQPAQPPQPGRPPQPPPGQPQLEAPPQATVPIQPSGQIISSITFRGARRVPQDTLRALITTKVGDIYNEEVLRRDFIALWNTGRFDDIRLEAEPSRT